MTLTRKVTLLVALAATLASVVAAGIGILAVRASLQSALDEVLVGRVESLTAAQLRVLLVRQQPVDAFVDADGPVVIVDAVRDGVVLPKGSITATVPVTTEQEDLAVGDPVHLETLETADGTRVRVASERLSERVVVRAIRSMEDVARTARRSGFGVLVGGLAVAVGVATAGAVMARRMMRPVRELAGAASRASRTQDPAAAAAEIPHRGAPDEVDALAEAIRELLTSLATSRAEQQRLVDDAAHELRTPLTSLRTNVELLLRASRSDRPLPAGQTQDALAGIEEEVEDLSALVQELIELASGSSARAEAAVSFRLDEAIEALVARARRRSGRVVDLRSEPLLIVAPRSLVERAVGNVVGNALKFSASGDPVLVAVTPEGVTVEDGGPGMSAEQRARATERFWRAPEARATPGSGLGLALAAEAMAQLGGSLALGESAQGGLRVECRMPGIGRSTVS